MELIVSIDSTNYDKVINKIVLSYIYLSLWKEWNKVRMERVKIKITTV